MTIGVGRVVHVNVNCMELDRSVAFYQGEIGLRPVTRSAPLEAQPGAAFGLPSAQWDAWMMGGPNGFRAPVVDLLQWIVPPPELRGDTGTVGFRTLHVAVPDGPRRLMRDPDGTAVEVRPGQAGVVGVTVACSDPARSRRFYDEIVGLGGFVELTSGVGAAPAAANTIGIWRLALATDDIDADVAALRRSGVRCLSDPVEMSMGPGLPALRFVLFPDPDGTMLELIERPAVPDIGG